MNRECLLLLSTLLLPGVRPAAQTLHDIRLTARPQPIEIEPGRTVHNGWLYNGALPGPTIRVTEGDTLRVTLRNDLAEPTTIHWHGLPTPLRADGVPGVSQGPVGIGQRYVYELTAMKPGSYWYHPHFDMQIDRGLVGALIVEPRNKAEDPPFDREHVVLLDDWLPADPPMVGDPTYSDYLLNGRTSKGQTPFLVKREKSSASAFSTSRASRATPSRSTAIPCVSRTPTVSRSTSSRRAPFRSAPASDGTST